MDNLSFDSFRIALLDPMARVRIEELIPVEIPRFLGIKLEGGFLHGQVVHFNKNLTCIIGGRGAGKSTLLESLRAGSGNGARENLLDCEVWPERISLIYQDEANRLQTLTKSKGYSVHNETDPESGPTCVPIESYGQGETAETIQHCEKDPTILLQFLDGFVDLGRLRDQDDELRNALLENQSLIEQLQLDVRNIPALKQAKANAEAQVKSLKEQDAGRVVEIEEKLAKGRRFRDELITRLNSLFETRQKALADTSLNELVLSLDGSELVVGQNEFNQVKTMVQDFAKTIERLSGGIQQESQQAITAINAQLGSWVARENDAQQNIETIRQQLAAKGIKLDMAFIRKVTSDVTEFGMRLNVLTGKQNQLSEAFKARRQLVQQRMQLKAKLYTERARFATLVTRNLHSTVVDYTVTVKYHQGVLSPAFEDLIKEGMGWRTSQVPRAHLITSALSPFDLLEAIDRRNATKLTDIRDSNGDGVFATSEAADILKTLSTQQTRHKVERCEFEDLPQITVSTTFNNPDGSVVPVQKDFGRLSLGQQQSILLSIMLFSKSNHPLVIDQPEDNLDSEFIYKTFVRTLRTVKEQRQVIVVTHNPNIAVLGDAELIIPLRGASDMGVIRNPGSIDNPATKTLACTILEGSEQAFKKRMAVYGF